MGWNHVNLFSYTEPPPCPRICPDRKPACHDSCAKYQEYKKKREELYKQKHANSAAKAASGESWEKRMGRKFGQE